MHRGTTTILDEVPKYRDQALNLLVGELLGSGAYRRVYAVKHSPDLVLKVDFDGAFHNAMEWAAWCTLEGTEWAKWVAPCVEIDEFTGALLQRRARPLTDDEWASLGECPAFLGDVGQRNWGWLDGRPVMVDYAINHMADRGIKRPPMRSINKRGSY